MSPIKACLDFMKSIEVDFSVVGVNNSSHLLDIISYFNQKQSDVRWMDFQIKNEVFLNPTNWKLKK
jgi:hypothetical protein